MRTPDLAPEEVWPRAQTVFEGSAMLGGPAVSAGGTPVWANFLMLGASAAWSIYTVGSHRLVERYGPMAFTAWTLWWGTVGVMAVAAALVRVWVHPRAR